MFLVLGNSHVRYFLGGNTNPEVDYTNVDCGLDLKIRQCGSTGATIWGLGNTSSKTNAGETIKRICAENATTGMTIIVLGDVDIREHLWKHLSPDRKIQDVVGELIARYANFVEKNVQPHTANVVLTAVVPFTFSFYRNAAGNDQQKAVIPYCRMEFNRQLEKLCAERRWTYFSFYDTMTDEHGCLLPWYSLKGEELEVHMDYSKTAGVALPALKKLAEQKGM